MDAHPHNGPNGQRRFRREVERTSTAALFDRQPPQSIEAEMSLLGSIILDPERLPDVIALIKGPEDFYKESHAHIYRAVLDIYDTRNTGDLVQIADLLRDRNVLDQIGGPAYLLQLAESVPAAVNAPHFARIVAEKAKLRRLIDAAGKILYDAYHVGELGPEGAREVLDRAEMSVFEIAQESSTADPQSLNELLHIEIDRIMDAERDGWPMTGVSTGYTDLDELLRGFQPGELVILAARPSMGKTALALNLAEQMAAGVPGTAHKKGVPVGFFSLEMSKNAIVQRLLSARSGVSSQNLRGGHSISKMDLDRLGQAADELKEAPIYIDDMPSMTALALRARARRMVAQHGVKVIMIDYLQLMTAPGAARESRQVEVSSISRSVKALARELNVPVVCLAQLNRASEQREGNRPRMADLRESGSIEQDADVILLLHREDYYHVQDEDWKMENPDKVGVAEIIVAKQRNGPTDIVKLKWDPKTTRFKNLDMHAQPPGGYGFDDYSSPSQAAAKFPSGPAPRANVEAKPWTQQTQQFTPPPFDPDPAPPPAPRPTSAFGARPKTGPAENHRDGGGSDMRPDFEEEEGL